MTAYNAGTYLESAVRSVVEQSYSNWELILIDNGSSDGSFRILGVSDKRINLVALPVNIGRTPALSLALEQARGEYVAVLDADDVAARLRLEIQHAYLQNHQDVGLVGSAVRNIDENSRLIGDPPCFVGQVTSEILGERNVFFNSSVMFRRDVALQVGGYDARFEYAQDYDLFSRILAVSRAVILPDLLTHIRVSKTSYTNDPRMVLVRAHDEMTLFSLMPHRLLLTHKGRRLNRRRRAIATLYMGIIQIRLDRTHRGVRTLARGMVTDPTLSWVPYLSRKMAGEIMNRVCRSPLVSPSIDQ